MSVVVYKGRLMGIGDYFNQSRQEGRALAVEQEKSIAALKTRLRQLNHTLVFLKGGGELTSEQRAIVAREVGDALANPKTKPERRKLLKTLMERRDYLAGMIKEFVKAHDEFVTRQY